MCGEGKACSRVGREVVGEGTEAESEANKQYLILDICTLLALVRMEDLIQRRI